MDVVRTGGRGEERVSIAKLWMLWGQGEGEGRGGLV